MNRELEKVENTYWKISKIIGVLFTLINYQMWTNPLHIVKAVFIVVGISVGVFIAVNVIDLCIGVIAIFVKVIIRKMKDKRILKRFCQTGSVKEK